jgi:hypothetical protein
MRENTEYSEGFAENNGVKIFIVTMVLLREILFSWFMDWGLNWYIGRHT